MPNNPFYQAQYTTNHPTISGTNTTINWNNGVCQHLDFSTTASGTYTVGFTGGYAGSAYILITKQNVSGTAAITWSGTQVAWQGGVSGTMTAASGCTDMFSFVAHDSNNNYYGSYSNNYF